MNDADKMNQQWNEERKKLTDAEWNKSLTKNVVFVPDDVLRERARLATLTPEERAADKVGERYLNDQIEEYWEWLREEAKAALAVNPNDEKATRDLLQCRQHDYEKKNPTKTFMAGGKVATPVGRFVKLRTGGWAVRITRSKVGDVVQVQCISGYKKQPMIKKVRLIKELGTSLYQGREQ
jgi:hypothetical protein